METTHFNPHFVAYVSLFCIFFMEMPVIVGNNTNDCNYK